MIAQYCGVTELGCTIQELVVDAHTIGLQTEILPVFGRPATIETLVQQVSFIAMIDVASLYGTTPMFQWHFVVPLAMQQDIVRFHNPADGPDRHVPRDDSLAAQGTAGYRRVRVWNP
jgi:hypothetical protein